MTKTQKEYVEIHVFDITMETTGSLCVMYKEGTDELPSREVWVPKTDIEGAGSYEKGQKNVKMRVEKEFATRHNLIER